MGKITICYRRIAKLISAFVFATRMVHFLYFLNPKLPDSNHLLCLYRPVCVRPGRYPKQRKLEVKGTSRQRSGKGAIRKRFPLQKPRWEKTSERDPGFESRSGHVLFFARVTKGLTALSNRCKSKNGYFTI